MRFFQFRSTVKSLTELWAGLMQLSAKPVFKSRNPEFLCNFQPNPQFSLEQGIRHRRKSISQV